MVINVHALNQYSNDHTLNKAMTTEKKHINPVAKIRGLDKTAALWKTKVCKLNK